MSTCSPEPSLWRMVSGVALQPIVYFLFSHLLLIATLSHLCSALLSCNLYIFSNIKTFVFELEEFEFHKTSHDQKLSHHFELWQIYGCAFSLYFLPSPSS